MTTKAKPFGRDQIIKKGECNDEVFILEHAQIASYPEKGKIIVTLKIGDKVAATTKLAIIGRVSSPIDRWHTVNSGKRIIGNYFVENVDGWNIPVRDKALMAVLLLNVLIWTKFSSIRGKFNRADNNDLILREKLREKVKLYRDTLLPLETN
ncbi:hypothetical protein SPLA10_PHROGS00173 [Salmonella phage SPLA10]|nr:hypothetical protein SPLA10_PHROGS00173 [Salmonella phage SPLA10]